MVWAWVLIIAGLAIAFYFGFTNFAAIRVATYIGVLLVAVGLFIKVFVKKYDEFERAIIFRLGQFNRIAGPGWAIVVPFFEKEFSKVDVRTRMLDLYIPQAFTSDDLRLKIDGVVYYRIVDPNKAILKIENYMTGLTNIIVSETRNLIAGLSMRNLFGGLDQLNDLLADKIRHATWKWGIDVPMVQLRGITPPDEIAVAMQQKEISAQMLQAQRFKAEAQKVVIEAIGEAGKKLDDRSLMYLYLKALEEVSKGSATKILFPMQFMDVMKGGFGLGSGLSGAGIDVNEAVEAVKKKILS
jgi:regulator of protease activity HflC (stomatin/prohibitin superfamily)